VADLGMPSTTVVPEGIPPLTEETRREAREIIARYPRSRSALLPMDLNNAPFRAKRA